MHSDVRPFHLSRWGRLLVLLLAGTVLLQGGPVQLLVEQARQTLVRHHCSQCLQGFCPRNPDGPCTCDHSSSTDSAEGLVLQACDGNHQAALSPAPSPKWLSVIEAAGPTPPLTDQQCGHLYSGLSSQCMGDDILRPPRFHAG